MTDHSNKEDSTEVHVQHLHGDGQSERFEEMMDIRMKLEDGTYPVSSVMISKRSRVLL